MTTPPGGTYPGPDPDDPFAKPPNESATPPPAPPPPAAPTEETAPIQREEVGYWEKQAQEQAASQPPPAPGYQQNPTTAQFPTDPGQPETTNPWAGYGVPAAPGSAVPPPPPPPSYGAPPTPYYATGVPAVQPPHPQATTVLVLGLIGLIGGCLCGLPALVAPFAWVMGARVKREIRESNGQLGGESNANAGFIMGIIGTVVLVLVLLGVVLLVVVGITAGSTTGTTTTDF